MIRLNENEIIVFAGDSITDGGRSRNMDLNHNLGHGHQFINAARLCRENMSKAPKFINKGYSGASVNVIYSSWYHDVIKHQPTMISILIGINDVFRGDPKVPGYAAEKYEKTYDLLLQDTKKLLPDTKLVLCEPFFVPTRNSKEFIKYSPHVDCDEKFVIGDVYSEEMIQYVVDELDKLQQAVRRLAKKHDCIFVPLQEEFDKALEKYDIETEYLLWDGVHPTVAGHGLIAEKWYQCVEKEMKVERDS